MKKTALFLTLFLGACATGKVFTDYDKFTNQTTEKFVVGQIKSVNLSGISDITANVLRVRHANNLVDYYFVFATYNEGLGNQHPGIRQGTKAILMLPEGPVHLSVHGDTSVRKFIPGAFAPACHESNIRVGPMTQEQMLMATNQQQLEFKIYGTNFPLQGIVQVKDLAKIRQFVTGTLLQKTASD